MNDESISEAFDLAIDYRLIAGELYTALIDIVTAKGCKCVLAPELTEWYEGMAEMTSTSARLQYAKNNPVPDVEQSVIRVCKACSAMENYQSLIGDEAVMLEKSKYLNDPEVMPAEIRSILDEELGHINPEKLMKAFMGYSDDEDVIRAIETASERTNKYLRDNDNTPD